MELKAFFHKSVRKAAARHKREGGVVSKELLSSTHPHLLLKKLVVMQGAKPRQEFAATQGCTARPPCVHVGTNML